MRGCCVGLVFLVACTAPRGYSHPRVDGITIVTEGEAAKHELAATPMSLEFGPGGNQDDLIVDFLAAARQKGATHVSSLAIHVGTSSADAGPLDCVTYVGPKHEVEHRWETQYEPGRTEYVRKLHPVRRSKTTYRYECKSVRKPHTKTVTEYRTEYDYSSKRSRRVSHTRMVTEYRTEQDCGSRPHTTTETTYEYRTETRYVPPKRSTVARTYSHWELVLSEPVCTPVDAGATAQNHIEGTIYTPTK